MALCRELMLIVWQRALSGKNSFDGSVDIREIKEVRKGKQSKDFDSRSEEARNFEVRKKHFSFSESPKINIFQC